MRTVESAGPGSGLWRVSANGGEPEELSVLDPAEGETNHAWPEILPSGNAVLFTILTGDIENAHITVLDLSSHEQKVLVSGGSSPRYARVSCPARDSDSLRKLDGDQLSNSSVRS